LYHSILIMHWMRSMRNIQKIQPAETNQRAGSGEHPSSLKFAGNSEFQMEIRQRVDEYFRRTGRRERDCPQMYAKTAILIASFISSYVLLVFIAQTWWQ